VPAGWEKFKKHKGEHKYEQNNRNQVAVVRPLPGADCGDRADGYGM
jgi:hypothetical protein